MKFLKIKLITATEFEFKYYRNWIFFEITQKEYLKLFKLPYFHHVSDYPTNKVLETREIGKLENVRFIIKQRK